MVDTVMNIVSDNFPSVSVQHKKICITAFFNWNIADIFAIILGKFLYLSDYYGCKDVNQKT